LAEAPPEPYAGDAEADDSSTDDREEPVANARKDLTEPETRETSNGRAHNRLAEQAADRDAAQETEGGGRTQYRSQYPAYDRTEREELAVERELEGSANGNVEDDGNQEARNRAGYDAECGDDRRDAHAGKRHGVRRTEFACLHLSIPGMKSNI
jgi:hypothetical protein